MPKRSEKKVTRKIPRPLKKNEEEKKPTRKKNNADAKPVVKTRPGGEKSPQNPNSTRLKTMEHQATALTAAPATQQASAGAAVTPGMTTFAGRQDSHRENCHAFFADKDNYRRLEKIVFTGKTVYPLLMHFVTEFSKDRMFLTSAGAVCPRAAYANALRSRKKRFYDFNGVGSRTGCGPLWYNGIRNPAVLANSENGSISLPLPLLVAVKWTIAEDFDTIFWEHYDEVSEHFNAHTKARKEKYMNTHKRNKTELRKQMESVFLQAKKARIREMQLKQQEQIEKDAPRRKRRVPNPKPKRDAYLTRADRAEVSEMIEEEKRRRKEDAKKLDRRKKRGKAVKPVPSYFHTETMSDGKRALPPAKPLVIHF